MRRYENLEFTDTFLNELVTGRFSASERAQIVKALALLDSDERHPSLRVHALQADLEGLWSASASATIRLTFDRLANGRKSMNSLSPPPRPVGHPLSPLRDG